MSSEQYDNPPTPPHESGDKISDPPTEITPSIPIVHPSPPHDSNLPSSAVARVSMSNASERAKILSDSNADPQTHVRALFYSLIYWDSPVKSGIALASILGGLIISSLVSPIRLIAALWSFSIFANLLFVHATLQYKRFTGQPSTNPHESAIKITHDGILKKGKIDRWVTLGVDFVNLAAQSAGKIVLVEDTHRSLSWLGWGVLVYFISGFLPTRWILGLGVTFTFSLPKFYSENQAMVDEQVSKANVIVRAQLDKAQALAQQHAGPYIEKVTELGQQYGLVHKQKNE